MVAGEYPFDIAVEDWMSITMGEGENSTSGGATNPGEADQGLQMTWEDASVLVDNYIRRAV